MKKGKCFISKIIKPLSFMVAVVAVIFATVLFNNKVYAEPTNPDTYVYGVEKATSPNYGELTLYNSANEAGEWYKASTKDGDYTLVGTGETLKFSTGDKTTSQGWYKFKDSDPINVLAFDTTTKLFGNGMAFAGSYGTQLTMHNWLLGNDKNTTYYIIVNYYDNLFLFHVYGAYDVPDDSKAYEQFRGKTVIYDSTDEEMWGIYSLSESSSNKVPYSSAWAEFTQKFSLLTAYPTESGVVFNVTLGESQTSLAVGSNNILGRKDLYKHLYDEYYPVNSKIDLRLKDDNSLDYAYSIAGPADATDEQRRESPAIKFTSITNPDYMAIGYTDEIYMWENAHGDQNSDPDTIGTFNDDPNVIVSTSGSDRARVATWVNRQPGDIISFEVSMGKAEDILESEFIPPHTHSWGYTADSNKITASCSEDGCPVTEGLTLEMVAPTNLTYDGTAKAVTLKDGYSTAAFANPTIKYFKDNAEVTECVNVGDYTAKVTYGNAVAVLTFEIVKANPTPTEVTDKNATYNQTLSEITLPDGWAWNSSTDKVGNVGTRVHKATFTPENTQNFNTVEQDVNVIVAKANPEYTVPTGLKVLINKTLADVTLPTGWAWDDNTLNVGNEPGNKTYKATFTPEDTDNYNLAEHIDVTVLVSLHEHNFTYTANGNKITATCTSADCPITEGLTLTMVAPTELTYSATAKVVTLQTGYNTEVFPNATIKYYKGTTEVTECVNAGEYTAKVTFGNATASVTFTILNWTIPIVDKGVTVEIEGAPKDITVEVEVEVKTDISSEEAKSDYKDAVSKKLEENQKIALVYDVKLIQKTIVGGVETKKEIQPSDIKPGTTIVIKMDIPTALQGKEFKLLHIHSANDIEFVNNFEVSKDGKTLTVKVNKLSEFAFVETVVLPAKSHGFCIGYVALIIAILLLIYTVFYTLLYFDVLTILSGLRDKLPLFNLISLISSSVVFVFGLIALIVHACPASIVSFIIIALEFGLILTLFILDFLKKKKNNEIIQKDDEEVKITEEKEDLEEK